MSTPVLMPQLGESVVEGTVGKWLVVEGQPVKEYEPLLQVTTDKVDTEIPAPASGVLVKIHVPEGQTVPKGTLLAEIAVQDAPRVGVRGQEAGGRGQEPEAHEKLIVGAAVPNPASRDASSPQYPISATPVAQRMAAEHGIDLTAVKGTGPGGRITKEDIEAHLVSTSSASARTIHNPQSPIPNTGFISPAVASLAAELGADLTQVIGTGAGGRITKKDVLAYVAAPVPWDVSSRPVAMEMPPWEQPGTGSLFKPTEEMGGAALVSTAAVASPPPTSPVPPNATAAAGDFDVLPLSTVRRAIAKHMVVSKQTSPHVTTVMQADMTRVVQARERLRGEFDRQGVKLTFTPFLVQAIVAGLRTVPQANSTYREDALLIHKRMHIGMAVAVSDGLIVPVIRDADEKSLLGLARRGERPGRACPHEAAQA